MIEEPTPEQLNKLPKWARAFIERQSREVTRLSYNLKISKEDMGPTDTYVDTYNDLQSDGIPLPKGVFVKFAMSSARFGGNGTLHDYVEVRVKGDNLLEVRGSDGIAIFPHSSNFAYVKLESPR